MEEIEYSIDCPSLKGTDLDSDINSNMSSADREEEDDEGNKGEQQQRGSAGQSQQSSMKSRLFPHLITEESAETLSEKRNMCNDVDITDGQSLS